MKNAINYCLFLVMAVLTSACSDPMTELETEVLSPNGTIPGPGQAGTTDIIPANISQTVGSCEHYFVYVISGATTTPYDRRATVTIIQDAYTDPDTGTPIPAAELEQHVLTIPAGSYVSNQARVLTTASQAYENVTYKVEFFTDTMGNSLSGYSLLELTYNLSEMCYTSQGNGGWSYDIKGCFDGKFGCDLNGNGAPDWWY